MIDILKKIKGNFTKKEYYNRKISEGEENSKDLFKVTNTLLHKENSGALPTHSSEKELTNDIGRFFKQKIVNLREQFPAKVRYQSTFKCSIYYRRLHFSDI